MALFVLATAVAILQSRPQSAPDCDDPGVARSLVSAMQGAPLSRAMITGSSGALHGTPQVQSVAQLAYARRAGVRACKGTLAMADGAHPMAFTIHLDKASKSGFYLVGAAPSVLAAGYSRLNQDGKFAEYVGPIGRRRLKQAFRDGVARLQPGAQENSAEIGAIEPAAACRPSRGSTVLRCRLLVERRPGTLLDGDFTFERDPQSGNWNPARSFGAEFDKAIAAAQADRQ